MRASLFCLAALCTSISAATAQTAPAAPDTASIRKQIEANQQAIGKAIHTGDFAALKTYWSPNMVVNSPDNNILTRDKVLEAMHHGGLNYTSLKTIPESFTVFGNTAVEMGHEDFVMAAGPSAGKPLQRRYTNIWQLTGSQWQQIARQATILDVPAPSVYGH